jgi:Domain of unknown function (DUF1874)
MFICNSFSLNMLPEWVAAGVVKFRVLTVEQARKMLNDAVVDGEEIVSAVGHADIAGMYSDQLGFYVPQNRVNASFTPGINERILVGQHNGPRLPEGTTRLPEGATIKWFLVEFHEDDIIEFTPDVWNGGEESAANI